MVRRNCHREGTFSFVSKTLTTTSLALSRKGYSVLFSLLMVYDFPMLLRLLILYSYFLIITVYTTTYSPGACRCNYTRPCGHTFIGAAGARRQGSAIIEDVEYGIHAIVSAGILHACYRISILPKCSLQCICTVL